MNEKEKEKIRVQVCAENCKHVLKLSDEELKEKCEKCPLYKL